MASIKWSAMVSEVKGVWNGSILSHDGSTQSIRNRKSGGGRKTDVWGRRKRALAFRASQWRALSVADQNSWQTMAASYPYIDKFGNPQIPSGYQLYCTLNLNLGLISMPAVNTPTAPEPEENIGIPAVSSAGAGLLSFSYTTNPAGASAVVIFATQAMSKGITSPPRNMRMISFVYSDTASPKNLALDYARYFSQVPTVGRVWFKWVQINWATGQRYGETFQLLDF